MRRDSQSLIRALVGLLTCAFGLLATSPGLGQAARDFEPTDAGWTGLSDFVSMAEEMDIDLVVADQIDWHEQSPDEVLIFVYPQSGLEIANAANYVVDGGHMLIADDFGASTPFLDRLDVTRVNVETDSLPHDHFVQENRALPIFEPDGRHPLLSGVDTLVANHPAVLLNVGGPVVSYVDGGGLVYDMNLGDGKVLLFADASLLINHMLSVADNGLLAQNALAYLCASRQPCSVRLVVRDFEQYGRYESKDPDDGSDEFSGQIEALNDIISDFMEEMPAARLLYYLGILLSAGLALYLAAIFRLRPSRPYSRYIAGTTSDVPEPQSEFDWNLSRFGSGGRDTNYALPLAILKEVFEELFLSDLGCWQAASDARPGVQKLGEIFARKHLTGHAPGEAERIEAEVVDLLASYARIPTRHRVFLDSDAYFSERDLINIYRRTRRILQMMGLEEEYERRTRSLV
ncbi:MAG: DUF4350 domain-containing protein [Persicimonas sp.]